MAKQDWEYCVPSLSQCCLMDGNSTAGLPPSFAVGTSSGGVQFWGENSAAPILESHDMGAAATLSRAAVTEIACLNLQRNYPRVVAADASGQLGLFEVTEKQQVERVALFKRHTASISGLSVGDSELSNPVVATCAEDGSTILSDMNTLKEVNHLPSEDSSALSACLLTGPDSVALGSAAPGRCVYLWDTRSKKKKKLRVGGTGQITALASPSAVPFHLVTGDTEGQLVLWDLRHSAKPKFTMTAHSCAITSLKMHPLQSSVVLSGAEDGHVKCTHLEYGRGETLCSPKEVPCVSVDVGIDSLGGPIFVAAWEDQSIVLRPVYST